MSSLVSVPQPNLEVPAVLGKRAAFATVSTDLYVLSYINYIQVLCYPPFGKPHPDFGDKTNGFFVACEDSGTMFDHSLAA